jgi:hypothetical protein
MAHQVRIGSLATACRFKAAPARKELLRQAVDRTCRERLDTALQHALSPVLDGQSGVIRIRRLDLNLTTTDPTSNGLAHLIAGRIAALVRSHLHQGRDGIQTWPDHGHFIAHYVLWRLGLRAGADWAFSDFDALQHLSSQQAVVEVLVARPNALTVLARDSILHEAPDAIVGSLDTEMIVALLKRLSDASDTTGLAQLRTYWITHAKMFKDALPESTTQPLAHDALMTMLRMLGSFPEQVDPNVPQTAMLARISIALASLPAVALLTHRTSWQARLATLQAQAAPAPALALLTQVAAQKNGPELLDSLATTIADRVHSAKPKTEPDAQEATDIDAKTLTLTMPAAGLALLLPGLVQLTARTPLTDAHRHAIALAALPEKLRREASRSAGFLRLFPLNPQAPDPTDWPMPDLTGLPEHLLTASNGPNLWAQAAMAHFSQRLPGLAGSSAGYLQDQFLNCTGDLTFTKTELMIALQHVPLGIVLSMGGHLGHRGRIPWHNDRALSITIKGGV